MTAVRWTDETLEIDAAAAAGAMKFAVECFIRQMRYGAIRGRVERGTGEDDGLYRLILQHADREVPMIVGRDGATISQELTMNVPKRRWRRPDSG